MACHKKDRITTDEITIQIIQDINLLILQAKERQLATVANILADTKERIALWAACDNYRDNKIESLLQEANLENGLIVALNFLAKFAMAKDETLKQEILQIATSKKRTAN